MELLRLRRAELAVAQHIQSIEKKNANLEFMQARLGELEFSVFYDAEGATNMNPTPVRHSHHSSNMAQECRHCLMLAFPDLRPVTPEMMEEHVQKLRAQLAQLKSDPMVSHQELDRARAQLSRAHLRLYEAELFE